MNPFDFFEKVYCINLKERDDRWESCLKKFKEYDIVDVERVEGVRKKICNDEKNNGRYGCTASWEKVLKKIVQDNVSTALVFEDDFEFRFNKRDLFKRLNRSISQLPDDWDMLYLGGELVESYKTSPITSYTAGLYRLLSCYQTHSIAVTNNGAKMLLSYFVDSWTDSIIKQYEIVDVFLARKAQRESQSFITTDFLCIQEPGKSNIENKHMDLQQYAIDLFELWKSKTKYN